MTYLEFQEIWTLMAQRPLRERLGDADGEGRIG